MSDKHYPNKSELTLSKNRSLAIKRSELVKRGLDLTDDVEKRQVEVPIDREKKAIESIIFDCEMHYRQGTNILSSAADFYAFLHEEVKFHAKTSGLDFEKAKEAYIFWAKKYHSAEYDKI